MIRSSGCDTVDAMDKIRITDGLTGISISSF